MKVLIFKDDFYFLNVCMSVCMYIYNVYMVGVHRNLKSVSDPLKLQLWFIVSHPKWVKQTTLGFSERAGIVLNYWTISPASRHELLINSENRFLKSFRDIFTILIFLT